MTSSPTWPTRFATRLLHTGHEQDPTTGAAAVPIYQVSMFDQPGLETPGEFDYARSGNPTRKALEGVLAALDEGAAAFAFGSGMAAVSSVLMLFSAGDHLVVTDDCYGGTYRVLTRVFSRFGLQATFVDTSNPDAVRAALRPNTKALFVESVSNPFLKRTDVPAMARIAKEHGVLLIVDNTFLSPCLSRPLTEGADIVIHSATKYLGGHSDVIAGTVAVRTPALAQELGFLQNAVGAVLGPQDCFLLQRGIKTLQVRMERQVRTAKALAKWLSGRQEVAQVFYPDAGAVVSFRLARDTLAAPFVESLQLPLLGVSLGAVESIVTVPARHSHAAIPAPERERRGITDGLIRFSVGLEELEDLQEDLAQAFAKALRVAA
ncbi:PLP-dependent aspartate aminotransferase family protein [Comamonas sp. JC664]|uniref:trans-sulfuration enzyme family protein n=1 Tax=Comamonas sp. JC664 TaxID=2801917 RepID=UPI001748F50C|nr:PLP-dependent aspartate aminotransferase family protein [Comamonas sp. JC664]MBL0697331.1 PLP-dependent transferase [Comamonas sp. JC664]GHG67097.1 cystathionine gamma-synthase [Comamonas sp. KCTC 72670]